MPRWHLHATSPSPADWPRPQLPAAPPSTCPARRRRGLCRTACSSGRRSTARTWPAGCRSRWRCRREQRRPTERRSVHRRSPPSRRSDRSRSRRRRWCWPSHHSCCCPRPPPGSRRVFQTSLATRPHVVVADEQPQAEEPGVAQAEVHDLRAVFDHPTSAGADVFARWCCRRVERPWPRPAAPRAPPRRRPHRCPWSRR